MTNCVDCPHEENYAAIALQLQETALQAEQCLYAAETALRRVPNPNTTILTLTNANAYSSVPEYTPMFGVQDIVFSNSARTSLLFENPAPTGVWMVGCNFTAVATGAINDNTYRELTIAVWPSDISTTTTTLAPATSWATTTVYEPNNGTGVDISALTVLEVGEAERIVFFFRHGNTSSTLNVPIGAFFWATRISDATALRVV